MVLKKKIIYVILFLNQNTTNMSEKYKSFIKGDHNFKNILYDKSGYKATITINREDKLNCVNLETIQELITAFKDSAWDDDIAVVVLTGAGKRAFLLRRRPAGAGGILPWKPN